MIATGNLGCRVNANVRSLPDYLGDGLDIIFVGLNPGLYSVQVGHYFATPRNRFWTAINRSGLLAEPVGAAQDHRLLRQGIGLTDVVKRATRGASELRAADFRRWAPVLKEKLERHRPRIVCFHGTTAYRGYMKHAEGRVGKLELGVQPVAIGSSQVFVTPNPSPANAAWSLADLVEWYRRLAVLRDGLRDGISGP